MRVLVTGAGGQLGRELTRQGPAAGLDVVPAGHDRLDIADSAQVAHLMAEVHPDLVVNAAAYTQVDRAETDRDAAFAVNAEGPGHLAEACEERDIPMIHVSTDFVFDGKKGRPYTEEDPVRPIGVYGESKAQGEAAVRAALRRHILLRTAWVFGVHGHNFVKTILRLAREREALKVVDDQHGCPTAAGDLARAILEMIDRIPKDGDATWGTYHFCGDGVTTWHGFARRIVSLARLHGPVRVKEVIPIPTAEYPTPAKRPAYSALDCDKIAETFGIRPLPWEETLERVVAEIHAGG